MEGQHYLFQHYLFHANGNYGGEHVGQVEGLPNAKTSIQ